MNVAMWSGKRKEYYIASVRKHANDDGRSVARGKRVAMNGKLLELCSGFEFATEGEAALKCRGLAKMKARKKDYVPVALEKLPKEVQAHLEVPTDMQMTPQEMVAFIVEAKRERYVVFADVTGMEDSFDAGVQYLGYETDDVLMLKVYDRCGALKECFRSRTKSVEPTERALEAEGKGKKE
jgi:hypothetical protein